MKSPLILLVGFLGAGKTSYLREFLPAARSLGLDPHVVINDYQNARIDAELLQGLAESIQPISGSCVCCGSRAELIEALLAFEPAPGRIMVIEANGTTDTEELIELLSLEPGMEKFTAPVQVSLIDAKRWQKRFWHNALERDQARTASFIHITRCDQVDERRLADVRRSLRDHGVVADECSPQEFAAELTRLEPPASRSKCADASLNCTSSDSASHDHGHSHHHFASVQLELPDQVSREALTTFLRELPREVLRAKGIIRLVELPEEFHIFQKVSDFDDFQLLPIGKESRINRSVAVLIGPAIDEQRIDDLVAQAFGTPAPR